jgi:hypothetical protein
MPMLDIRGIEPMSKRQVIWNGTEAESHDLLASVRRHCACQFDQAGVQIRSCPPHDALASSQRFLDGLLFARRIAERLRAEEGVPRMDIAA